MRLNGKIALITGAASNPGIGSATAFRFAQEGASLFLTDIDGEGAERVAQEIRQRGGVARALAHDVTKAEEWDVVFAALVEAFGRLDVLVNNAGIAIPNLLVDATQEEWSAMYNVNATSVFLGCQRAVPLMSREGAGGGSIINIASMAGSVGLQGLSAYCASKGAVRLLTKGLALETAGVGIRVNSVHPGIVRSQNHIDAMAANPASGQWMSEKIPMKRVGEPGEIANMNLFLASDEASYITGAEFMVDGGYTAA